MLDHVPLTWTPTLGIVYVASPLICVRYGSTMRQYGFVTDIALPAVEPAMELFASPVAPAPSSGKAARTAQLSGSRRPVLVPPCTVSPFRSRATTLTSTPCQFSICFPKLLADCASSSTCPTLVGMRLYRPLIVWPPPPGSRGSTGATMLNGV